MKTKMVDVENCVICGKHIGKGNDPAVCKSKRCMDMFKTEIGFQKWVKEEFEKEGIFTKTQSY